MIQLGFAGLIPFILLPVCSLVWPILALGQAMQLFQFYSCLILGFMAGALWPAFSHHEINTYQLNRRALWAVSFPVAAFISVALLPTQSVVILALLFAALRMYEWQADIDQYYTPAYRTLRNRLTSVVVFCHLGFYAAY